MAVNRWNDVVSCQIFPERISPVPWDIKELEKLLFDAVRNCLSECQRLNDRPETVLCFSGGLDSTLLLRIMMISSRTPHTFTIGPNAEHPDIVASKAVMKAFDIEHLHHVVIPTPEQITEAKAGLRKMKQPDNDGSAAVFLCHKAIRAAGFKTFIAGDGIDEIKDLPSKNSGVCFRHNI